MHLQHIKTYFIISFSFFIIAGMTNSAYAAPPLKLSPANLSGGTQYQAYSPPLTLTGSNGTTPYSWQITAGSLPPGLSFTPLGTTADISGTPTQAGTFSFTVTLTDSSIPVQTVSNTYSITISAGNCTFVGSNTGSISFSNIDPSTTPGPILGTVTQQINFTCKSGMAYTVTASPASGWTMVSGGNSIAYTLGFTASGAGLGAASIPLLTTTSQILQTDYANAAGGYYANSQPITLTVTWTLGGGGSIDATLPAGTVSGTVINNCLVTTAPGIMTFSIDPSISGTTSATISPDMQINCTKGDAVTISASSQNGGAAPAIKCTTPATCGTSQIPYTFKVLNSNAWPVAVPSASITGFGGAGVSLGLSGSVNSVDYANAPVGSYADVETLTINY